MKGAGLTRLTGGQKRCFLEELPKDTLVSGQYKAEEKSSSDPSQWAVNPDSKVQITVEEIFDNDHMVVNQRGSFHGKFTFTAAEDGVHRLCFQIMSSGGWFSSTQTKFHLNLAIGQAGELSLPDASPGGDNEISRRIRELKKRMLDIKREQVFQRTREAQLRDMSENANSRVIKYSIIQVIVLGITCAWQLTHLGTFFKKQKIV